MSGNRPSKQLGRVSAKEAFTSTAVFDRLTFLAKRFGERLWVKPLAVAILSSAAVFLAKLADRTHFDQALPSITSDSLAALLSIMGASMLVIATFAVASMVSAYASASSAATPRSFALVVADDVSQNALSTFIGSFIFSIVALTAVKNEFFEAPGRAALFVVTVVVFALVILTFVRWVDRIARLGRLGNSIEKVEEAATTALNRRRRMPTLRAAPVATPMPEGRAVHATTAGYVQRVDVARLQSCAEKANGWVRVVALPGTFAMHGRPLAYIGYDHGERGDIDEEITKAFTIGTTRRFEDDPRFGLIVLSEIADKALSPGINDPGTAIAVLGSMARLFALWVEPTDGPAEPHYARVQVPELDLHDMFDDAFTAIARDGAGSIEVVVRLQKVLASLASLGDGRMHGAAVAHARRVHARAEKALGLPEEVALARSLAAFAQTPRT